MGRFVWYNWPASMKVTIELLSLRCEEFDATGNDPKAAEPALIQQWRPCFNILQNSRPARLPEGAFVWGSDGSGCRFSPRCVAPCAGGDPAASLDNATGKVIMPLCSRASPWNCCNEQMHTAHICDIRWETGNE